MFHLAYPSCKAIGSVLLQTAPACGLSVGRMESLLTLLTDRSLTRSGSPNLGYQVVIML
jgi:hypothetical protein